MRKTTLAIVSMALLMNAHLLVAQHTHAAAPAPSTEQSPGDDMMKACQKHGSETITVLNELDKTIAAGRESNDAAKMKAALDRAQTELAEARHHMSMCPIMSDGTMQHGGMDHMQHTKGMAGQQGAPESTKPPQ